MQGIQQSLTQAIILIQKHLPHAWAQQPRCFGQALGNCPGRLSFMHFQQANNTLSCWSTTCAQKEEMISRIPRHLSYFVLKLSHSTK